MSEEVMKGGFPQDDWVAHCAGILERFGYKPYPAECAALAAWEQADEWMTPDEAAHEELVADAD